MINKTAKYERTWWTLLQKCVMCTYVSIYVFITYKRGRLGLDRMVVGFYNYLCSQCLSPLMWVQISIRVRCTTLCDKVCQWLATGRWFSPGPPVSSTNNTDRRDITEILLNVALKTIKQKNKIFLIKHQISRWYVLVYDMNLKICSMRNLWIDRFSIHKRFEFLAF